jgi:hypothetical protein
MMSEKVYSPIKLSYLESLPDFVPFVQVVGITPFICGYCNMEINDPAGKCPHCGGKMSEGFILVGRVRDTLYFYRESAFPGVVSEKDRETVTSGMWPDR